jgi:hypothetical protein
MPNNESPPSPEPTTPQTQTPSEPVVDLFIKTFPRDYPWLPYLLRSIEKFCRGFRYVIIVHEGDLPTPYAPKGCEVFLLPANRPQHDPDYNDRVSLGYQYQKAIKVMWPGFYGPAVPMPDAVVQVDSDMIFARPTTPESFRQDCAPVWLRREWVDMDHPESWAAWGPGMEWFARGNPVLWNYMVRPGFYLTREATTAFGNHLTRTHGMNPYEFFLSREIPHQSEYNLFGLFLQMFADRYRWSGMKSEDERHHFGYRLLTPEEFEKPCPLLQFHSWTQCDQNGQIHPDIITQIEGILQ